MFKDYGFKIQDLGEMSKYGVSRRIQYRIWSSSVTIVLVGETTGQSKWVDWEIWYSLREISGRVIRRRIFYPKGLIAIYLPVECHCVPQRLKKNLESGYARGLDWINIENELENLIAEVAKSRYLNETKKLIRNDEKPEVNPQWLGLIQYYIFYFFEYAKKFFRLN